MNNLFEKLGAFYGWVWNKHYGYYDWTLLYWPAIGFENIDSQIKGKIVKGYWSGFMSKARGLHWKRRPRNKDR